MDCDVGELGPVFSEEVFGVGAILLANDGFGEELWVVGDHLIVESEVAGVEDGAHEALEEEHG